MSHVTSQLCPRYPGERIQQWEYDLEAKEWAAIGFHPTVLAEGIRHRLPAACFFSESATREDVLAAWARIKSRLGRTVRLECTIGLSFGKDLAPLPSPARETADTQPAEPPTTASEDALSSAFNKLFKPQETSETSN